MSNNLLQKTKSYTYNEFLMLKPKKERLKIENNNNDIIKLESFKNLSDEEFIEYVKEKNCSITFDLDGLGNKWFNLSNYINRLAELLLKGK